MADGQRQDLERRGTCVGITGHRRLDRPEVWPWVAEAMANELASLRPPLVGVTSLAIGADQLFARLVLERGGKLRAVLPFAGIERSFSAEDVPAYLDLASRATVEVLETPGTEEDSYLAAGRRVVELSDVVLAIWNGRPAAGRGGTAEIVAYALCREVPLIHIDPVSRIVQRHPASAVPS